MSIHTMISREEYECHRWWKHKYVYTIDDYSGHSRDSVRHDEKCPRASVHTDKVDYDAWKAAGGYGTPPMEGCPIYSRYGGPARCECSVSDRLYMQERYKGCVLVVRERNYHDDSDFYAVVWDEETYRLKDVEYATTRGWTYPNHADVDATAETLEKAQAYMRAYGYSRLKTAAEAEARQVAKDKRVRVIKGRKVPLGTEGVVFYTREETYGRGQYAEKQVKIGISPSGQQTNGKYLDAIWTYASNVMVLEWEKYLPSDEELNRRAESYATAYHAPFVGHLLTL